jgi:hypothetical protein
MARGFCGRASASVTRDGPNPNRARKPRGQYMRGAARNAAATTSPAAESGKVRSCSASNGCSIYRATIPTR